MHRRARARPRLATRRRRRLHVQVPCALALTQKAARAGARARTFTEHSLSLGRGGVVGSKRGKPEDEDTESDTYLATVQKGPSALCICVGLPNLPYAHCTYMQPYCINLHTLHIHIVVILHILSCSRSKRNRTSTGFKSGVLALQSSVPLWDSIRMTTRMALAPCQSLGQTRMGSRLLKLTKGGRPSIKKNEVNVRCSTKYRFHRSPSNQRKLFGKSLSSAMRV